MTIQELLAKFLPDDIGYQALAKSVTNIKATKRPRCYSISFLTNAVTPTSFIDNTGPFGIVIWLPREKFNQFCLDYLLLAGSEDATASQQDARMLND